VNPAIVLIAVAVARCWGGNHLAERIGPEVNATGPANPFNMLPRCANLHSDTTVMKKYVIN